MNDTDIIRRGVELADGFDVMNGGCYVTNRLGNCKHGGGYRNPEQWYLDALAAQLVRQVDGIETVALISKPISTTILGLEDTWGCCDKGRSINTITAIVEWDAETGALSNKCQHRWRHDVQQLTTKPNTCLLCGALSGERVMSEFYRSQGK